MKHALPKFTGGILAGAAALTILAPTASADNTFDDRRSVDVGMVLAQGEVKSADMLVVLAQGEVRDKNEVTKDGNPFKPVHCASGFSPNETAAGDWSFVINVPSACE